MHCKSLIVCGAMEDYIFSISVFFQHKIGVYCICLQIYRRNMSTRSYTYTSHSMTMKFLCLMKEIIKQIMCSQEKGFKLNRFMGKILHMRGNCSMKERNKNEFRQMSGIQQLSLLSIKSLFYVHAFFCSSIQNFHFILF